MVPYLRLLSVLVLGLAANRADGETCVDVVPSAKTITIPSPASDLEIDRSLPTLLRTGPFLAYSLEPPLEVEACSASDKGRQLRGRIESAVIRTASEQLTLPMGAGRYLAVNGQRYLFCLEPHYREPGTGRGPTGAGTRG